MKAKNTNCNTTRAWAITTLCFCWSIIILKFEKDSKFDVSVPRHQSCSEILGLLNDYVMRTSMVNSKVNAVGFNIALIDQYLES